VLIIVAANVMLSAMVLVKVIIADTRDGRYAVIARPGSHPSAVYEIVAQAGGTIVVPGALDNVVIAQSEAPDFRAKLIAAGAILVVNPLLASACQSASR
jgi:hypothetical protein